MNFEVLEKSNVEKELRFMLVNQRSGAIRSAVSVIAMDNWVTFCANSFMLFLIIWILHDKLS